jgi:uncharacterized protein (TIGR02646 family)
MRALDRPQYGPPVLRRFRPGQDTWDQVTPDDKQSIWDHLHAMQGERCAYCEGDLNSLGRHIEHHHPRSRLPQATFDWHNLLGACDRLDSCGHFKDSPGAPSCEIGDLVDPSAEDPDRFFRIRDTGRIEPRPTPGTRDHVRAVTTLRALNLNGEGDERGQHTHRWRVADRRRALEPYLEPGLLSALSEFTDEERAAYIASELAATQNDPYATIIRHFFQE